MEHDAEIRQKANYKELGFQKRNVFQISRNESRVEVRMAEEKTGNSTRRRWEKRKEIKKARGRKEQD